VGLCVSASTTFNDPLRPKRKYLFPGRAFFDCSDAPYLQVEQKLPQLWVCVPHLLAGGTQEEINEQIKVLLELFFEDRDSTRFVFWYYTPVGFEFSRTFTPGLIVHDCMDELSAFKFAPTPCSS
jgi:UDP-galactopyranose mutase